MSQVDRFSVSLDTELLAAFDRHIADKGYENRSEAIRDMIRDLLVGSRLQRGDEPVAAVLTVVCDHREGDTSHRVRTCLSNHDHLVCGWHGIRVDQSRDYLAISLRGTAEQVQAVAGEIQTMRGVTHGRLCAVPATGI